MDVEGTIQFILESQAKTEARGAKAEARATGHEARMAKHEARTAAMEAKHEARMAAMDQQIRENRARIDSRLELAEDRFNRRIDAIRKLIVVGMKMQVANQKGIAELRAAQKETAKTLKTYLSSLNNGGNGRRRNGR